MATIKNYTSAIPASSSIERIEKQLIKMGAKNINKEYENGALVGIKFLIDIEGNTVAFELPANVKAVFDVLWLDIKRPRPETERNLKEQAVRTAWKIIDDWVQVQAAMIALKQAEMMQVFLPYAVLPSGQSVYHSLRTNNFKMLK